MNRVLAVLLAAAAVTPALAQVAPPSPGQIVAQQLANQARFQAQLQANQLDQLQRQNSVNLQQPDPPLQAQAEMRRRQIQQQIDQNNVLRQQMLANQTTAADAQARLQQSGAQIQQLQQTQPIP